MMGLAGIVWDIWRHGVMWDLARRIRKHGWTGVFVHDYERGVVPFAYSLGFREHGGAPEVIMFGMPKPVASQLIARAYDALKAGALSLEDKATWTLGEGDESWTSAWRPVHPSQIRREHFNIAIWYETRRGAGREGLEAFQLFAPDRGGKFPWEEGHDADYTPRQPELYLPYFGPAEDD